MQVKGLREQTYFYKKAVVAFFECSAFNCNSNCLLKDSNESDTCQILWFQEISLKLETVIAVQFIYDPENILQI